MTTTLPHDVSPHDANRLPPGMRDPSRRKIWTPAAQDTAIFEKYGRETGGEYTQLLISVAPSGGNPAHYHGSYSETFTSTKGSCGIYTASMGKFHLTPGESATVKPGEVHYFFNDGDEDVEMRVRLEPAVEGFERALYILYGLARDGKSREGEGGVPKSLIEGAICFAMSDMWLAGPVGIFMNPVFKFLAFVGRLMGVEERLLKTYWD